MAKVFRPLGDRILVRPNQVPERSRGLSTPDQQKEKVCRGIVLHVAGYTQDLCAGDEVQWKPYAGREVTVDGEKLRHLSIDELDGIWEEPLPPMPPNPQPLVDDDIPF